MSNSILPSFPVFFDNSDQRLEGGYIYIGEPNQNPETTPQQAYWDKDLTQAADQPIRTVNGRPALNGSPRNVYVSGDYSITIRDSQSQLVYTVPEVPLVFGDVYTNNIQFNTVADLLADTNTYSVGTYVQVKEGGFTYKVVASGGDVQNSAGAPVQFEALFLSSPLQLGAVGDGATNDASYVDAVNTSGRIVDLMGKDYAYTGDFTPSATFKNGKVISSSLGSFDYTVPNIFGDKTVTVGTGQTLTTLEAALNWLQSGISINGSLTLSVAGDHTVSDYDFNHPDSAKVSIVGSALSGAMPTKADMTGTEVTDLATLEARFTAEIDVGGSGDNTSGGLRVPNGLGLLENILVKSNTRYSLDVGFSSGHGNSTDGRRLRLNNCAFYGGVWGIIAVGVEVRYIAGGSVFFAYQTLGSDPGGPVDYITCNVRIEGAHNAYIGSGSLSKYGLYCESNSTVLGDNNIDISGTFQNGVFAVGSYVQCSAMITEGVTSPITANPGSFIECFDGVFSGGDQSATSGIAGADQKGWGNNNLTASIRACVFSGGGSTVSLSGCTFDNMIAQSCFYAAGGKIRMGAGGSASVSIDDCRWVSSVATFEASGFGNWYNAVVTNPKASSLDQTIASSQSGARVDAASSGASFSPSLDTLTNGNLLSSVA